MNNLGAHIKKHRERIGLTQVELAAKINSTQKAVSSWERNRTEPSVDSLIELSKAFRISLDTLILDQEPIDSSETLTASEKALIKVWREADELRRMQAYAGLLVNPDYSFTSS